MTPEISELQYSAVHDTEKDLEKRPTNQKTWILSLAQARNKRFHANDRRKGGKAKEEGAGRGRRRRRRLGLQCSSSKPYLLTN